jgi:hypothetical protein
VFNFEHHCWQMLDGTFAELDFHQMADLRVYTLVLLSDTHTQYFRAKNLAGRARCCAPPRHFFKLVLRRLCRMLQNGRNRGERYAARPLAR